VLHAHLVLVRNHRRPVFTNAILTVTENTIRGACANPDAESNDQTDHVHLLIAYPPTVAISTGAQRVKGREFTGACVHARIRGHLRSRSYIALSCAGAPLPIISNTSTANSDHPERRAPPDDTPDVLSQGLKSEACAQESGQGVILVWSSITVVAAPTISPWSSSPSALSCRT
jgi:putative transposase